MRRTSTVDARLRDAQVDAVVCSSCGKAEDEVANLIAGPSAEIEAEFLRQCEQFELDVVGIVDTKAPAE